MGVHAFTLCGGDADETRGWREKVANAGASRTFCCAYIIDYRILYITSNRATEILCCAHIPCNFTGVRRRQRVQFLNRRERGSHLHSEFPAHRSSGSIVMLARVACLRFATDESVTLLTARRVRNSDVRMWHC
jgi:hypothetical protein